jgi:hypothetical protein
MLLSKLLRSTNAGVRKRDPFLSVDEERDWHETQHASPLATGKRIGILAPRQRAPGFVRSRARGSIRGHDNWQTILDCWSS